MTNDMIHELEAYYSSLTTLPQTLVYNEHTTITDVPKFVESHLRYVKANPDKRSFQGYYARLVRVRELLEQQLDKQPVKKKRTYLRKSK